MAPQQSRIIALAPERRNVSLSLNAPAIYVGAAVGSAVGGAVIDGLGFSALNWTSGLAMAAVLAHILLSMWLVWRERRAAAGFGMAGDG